MSPYEEICLASTNAIKRWSEYRERSWGYLAAIIRGLVTHCGVPEDKISYLRSNGLHGNERKYSPPNDGGQYTLMGHQPLTERMTIDTWVSPFPFPVQERS